VSLFETLKFIHVLFAVTWVGGGIFLVVTVMRSRGGPLAHKLAMARNIEVAGRIFMISGIVVLAMGIWMVLDTSAYEFSQAWILIGLIGLLASALTGGRFFDPQAKALIAEYEAGDEAAGDARTARILRVAYLDQILLLVIVWAMVVKPGL
jgi:uncharacterized membrane protein